MKRCLVIILVMTAIALTACNTVAVDEPTEPPPVQYSVTELVSYKPNTYELHYRTTFSNGFIVDRWTTVSPEEFERRVRNEYR